MGENAKALSCLRRVSEPRMWEYFARATAKRGQERALYGSDTGEATASGIAGSIGSSAYGKDASALEGR